MLIRTTSWRHLSQVIDKHTCVCTKGSSVHGGETNHRFFQVLWRQERSCHDVALRQGGFADVDNTIY